MSQAVRIDSEHGPAPPARQGRRAAILEANERAFLRLASHELRTPLNSILGFSEILSAELYGPLGAPQYKEYAEIIRESGQRLLKLVNQLLDIARLQQGGGAAELVARVEPLDPVIDDVLQGLREEIRLRRATITVIGDDPPPAVLADPRGLRTALGHLLHNALVFSPPDSEVRIAARRRGAHVELSVEDQGEGIDAEDIPRLLRPFEQGESALARHAGGAGLGLSIADLLCRAMGGRLKIASAPGAGALVTMRLPAA